jgi:phage gp16-like protein
MTQMNLGNALETLGERESGTGKLEEAVAAYREALKEYTPQTHQRNYQDTMDNLNRVLTLLKKKGNKKAAVHYSVALIFKGFLVSNLCCIIKPLNRGGNMARGRKRTTAKKDSPT